MSSMHSRNAIFFVSYLWHLLLDIASTMKLVTAIIKPQQVDNVKEDLNKLGIHGLTATDVKGFGRQKGHTEFYRGSEFEVAFLPKTKLEVAIPEEKLRKSYRNY